jgi:hypothetical protein
VIEHNLKQASVVAGVLILAYGVYVLVRRRR